MASLMRQIHAWVAWLLVASIVVQVWLAGAAIIQLGATARLRRIATSVT